MKVDGWCWIPKWLLKWYCTEKLGEFNKPYRICHCLQKSDKQITSHLAYLTNICFNLQQQTSKLWDVLARRPCNSFSKTFNIKAIDNVVIWKYVIVWEDFHFQTANFKENLCSCDKLHYIHLPAWPKVN